jgi:hypothetical protein
MRIAALHDSADTRGAQARSEAMQWFEAIARAVVIALVVLIGASIVRNVTDALTMATHGPTLQRTAQLINR